MKPTEHLPVHERFIAFQGEGVHMGRKAFFIRTMGCPVKCPWCDSAGTWHKEWMPPVINRIPLETLVAEVIAEQPDFVVLTGGEPLIHAQLPTFARMLRMEGFPVHVETCGAFPTDVHAFDWITLSPKRDRLPDVGMILAAHEFKLIIDQPDAFDYWVGTIDDITETAGTFVLRDAPVWLHPEWSRREDPAILNAITKTVTAFGSPYRAGYQLHKLYRCDSLDARTAKLAPLGGNPELGY